MINQEEISINKHINIYIQTVAYKLNRNSIDAEPFLSLYVKLFNIIYIKNELIKIFRVIENNVYSIFYPKYIEEKKNKKKKTVQ